MKRVASVFLLFDALSTSVDQSAVGRRAQSAKCAAAILPWALLGVALLLSSECLAQGAHHPFAVGANEGAVGRVDGLSGWILAKESGFYRLLTGAIRAAKESSASAWGLAGLSLAYGVFHAAGPGHGKAVIASYMLANERVLRRGLVISLAAALLQGAIAIAIVGVAALVLGATAKHMTAAAHVIETVGYAGIVALGAALVFTKGAALRAAWRAAPIAAPEFASAGFGAAPAGGGLSARFTADDCSADHVHGPGCGHFHAPDPRTLDTGFAWKTALLTVLAAGSRPCSGAILVLVFAAAQGIFLAGVGAVVAMSLGAAATTGALASLAVFAKKTATKYSTASSWQALVAGRLFEVGAALAVLIFGLALLVATLTGAAGAAS
ncbi:nickel/cobalt transporter [Methylocapsa polymorpha]|uniref:Nickel/cobalt efflux system n=1 Tax=Methylocapsa polymorpha TaxID=3080828 RepID=A0ABZ0HXU1_9HYPH|nr:nickel/cobalt transporter [Methylocapsa sp. RX1]